MGPGHSDRTSYFAAPCGQDDPCDDFSVSFHNGATASFELALRFQWRVAEVGAVGRCQTWASHHDALCTLGPTFGVGF